MSGILIVEDEDIERDFLKLIVEKEVGKSYEIWTCVTGNQAIELAKKNRPSIIFMDILIPEKDGLTSLRIIKKFLPEVKVIILSAFSDFSYAQKAIELQVNKYLLKPANPAEIITALKELIESSESVEVEIQDSDNLHYQSFIRGAIQFIEEKYTEPLTLEMASAHVFMTPQYFSRVFKKEVGLSYTDYVNNLRIKYACHLLKDTDYPSYRISSECGFNDPSYFNRVFYKQMNITPIKYRKKIKAS